MQLAANERSDSESTKWRRMNSDYSDVFNPEGPLARALPGYAHRPEQAAMAKAVGLSLARLEPLIVEAGTGTGKTFAYLVPALLSGRSVIISTGTRTLQDQLFRRDVPLLARALGLPVKIALLKGRTNYLCRHRLELATQQGSLLGVRVSPILALPCVRRSAQCPGGRHRHRESPFVARGSRAQGRRLWRSTA